MEIDQFARPYIPLTSESVQSSNRARAKDNQACHPQDNVEIVMTVHEPIQAQDEEEKRKEDIDHCSNLDNPRQGIPPTTLWLRRASVPTRNLYTRSLQSNAFSYWSPIHLSAPCSAIERDPKSSAVPRDFPFQDDS